MILAIDIGNTNIVIGVADENKIHCIERISTVKSKTEAEYAVDFKILLDLHKVNLADISGGIVSSVVPQVTQTNGTKTLRPFGFSYFSSNDTHKSPVFLSI